jgi:hypothetical protein
MYLRARRDRETTGLSSASVLWKSPADLMVTTHIEGESSPLSLFGLTHQSLLDTLSQTKAKQCFLSFLDTL